MSENIVPHPPRPGQSLDAHWGSKVVEAIRSITPRPGSGIIINTNSGGTTISLRKPKPSSSDEPEPEQKSLSPYMTSTKSGKPAWTVTPGTINGQFPKTATGEIASSADARDWAVPIVGIGYICGKLTTNTSGTKVASREVVFLSSRPPEAFPPEVTSHIIIGKILKKGSAYKVVSINKYNLGAYVLGGAFMWGGYY